MKRLIFFSLFVLCFNVLFAFGQEKRISPDRLWQETDDSLMSQKSVNRSIIPNKYRSFTLDKKALQNLLNKAPTEFKYAPVDNSLVMTLPMPDGTFARFLIEEAPIFEPALAAKHPEIKTYRGKGIDDPTATARFDFTPQGFHSMILSTGGTILVDPYSVGDTDNYISYAKSDVDEKNAFVCDVKDETFVDSAFNYSKFTPEINVSSSGATLRTYRLAIAATAEYTNRFRQTGDTDAQAKERALAAMTTTMNRVNGVYEKELAIRMVLVANQDSIIYTDAETDPYTNTSGSTMLGQNQTNLDTVIGTANYDIGHVFSTGGGGIASVGVPCGSGKARGVTGLSNPVGDFFAIDYVAHEMGHQWGASHTFNGTVGSCSSNRSTNSAYEPGSGVTIMAYAGICGNQNLATQSIDTFHVKSLEVIANYSQNGNGSSCAVQTATGNIPPTVSAPASFNIPKGTPFALTASATDANGDSVTYDWQQYDLGASTTAVPNDDSDGQARPLFRTYLPTVSGTRSFPSMKYVLGNANVPLSTTGNLLTGEILPGITRTMNFQVIARDNRANGGGFSTAMTTVNVDGNSGPFVITAPNSGVSWSGNSSQTITWNAANTTNAPVSAASVRISLSTDGGQTFPTVLAASTPNDGTEAVIIPSVLTTQARIKVEAVGNIFFDVSDANFSITSTPAASVSIAGKVTNAQGRGIARARVTMNEGSSNQRTVITNPFGYYRFDNVPSNVSYSFTVGSKSYRFNNFSVLFVGSNVTALNFIALP